MMRRNAVKEKLLRGEVVFGCHVMIPHPAIAEIVGMAGFDFVMMDGEHGPFGPQNLENMVRGCDSVGVVAMARLPVNEPQAMLPFLDTGILGAQLPHCVTKADVLRLVEGVKYAPIGKRGVAGARVAAWGAVSSVDHAREWNEQMLAIAGVEDIDAVQHLPDMLAVPGIDVIAIGLDDLANSMGYTSQHSHPAVQEAVATIVREARGAGRWVSVAPRSSDPEEARHYAGMGIQMLKYSERALLRQSATAVLNAARAAVG